MVKEWGWRAGRERTRDETSLGENPMKLRVRERYLKYSYPKALTDCLQRAMDSRHLPDLRSLGDAHAEHRVES